MNLSNVGQLLTAGWFFLLGAGLGFFYDCLGGLRDAFRLRGLWTDGLFCLCALTLLFGGGMMAQEGRTGLYMLIFAVLGGGVWGKWVSPVMRSVWRKLWGWLCRGFVPLQKGLVRLAAGGKKLFSKGRKWITIRKKTVAKAPAKRKKGENRHETSPVRMDDLGRDPGAYGLCLRIPVEYENKSG